ncbi:hypothetical protein GCM10027318_14240 [Massilia agilis]
MQACGSDVADSNPVGAAAPKPAAVGFVSFDQPMYGASASVVDLSNPAAVLSLGATNANGMFTGGGLKPGGNYRIKSQGGTLSDGTVLAGTMAAEVRNYSGGVIYLTPLTTLASRYLAAHPQLDLPAAEAAVRRFLELPENRDLGAGSSKSTPEFDYSKFYAAMGSTGMDGFIDSLVAKMDAVPATTLSFAGRPLLQSGTGSLATYVGSALVEGALSELGGMAVSNALSGLGLGDQTGAQLSQINEQLRAIQNQLRDMQTQLSNVQLVTSRIATDLKMAQYNDGVATLGTLLQTVQALTTDLTALVNESDAVKLTDSYKQRRTDFLNSVCKIYTIDRSFSSSSDVIDNRLRGLQAGATPLITLYKQSKTVNRLLFNADDSQDLYAVRKYWETVQAQLFKLVDVYLSVGPSEDGCNAKVTSKRYPANDSNPTYKHEREDLVNGFKQRQLAQLTLYPTQLLPKDTAVDLQRDIMVRTQAPVKGVMTAYPWARGYSTSQDSLWNYAHLTMASDQSPMPASPAYLRQGWRLINNDELRRYFLQGYDMAVQYGWPAASVWGDWNAVMEDITISDEYFLVGFNPARRNYGALYSNTSAQGVAIAVRPLVPGEDYRPK